MLFLTSELANEAEITILSARDTTRGGSRQALPKETYLVQRCCVVICCGVETKFVIYTCILTRNTRVNSTVENTIKISLNPCTYKPDLTRVNYACKNCKCLYPCLRVAPYVRF